MARLVLIAPGRGSYNRGELGYLRRFSEHPAFPRRQQLFDRADALRDALGRPTISLMDGAEAYSPALHLPGENASSLIFTCSAADRALISQDHRIAAVLGNSMGWYTTLFSGGALDFDNAFQVVETMAHFQKRNIRGGQIIYPVVDDNWLPRPDLEAEVHRLMEDLAREEQTWVGLSIRLGGFLVLAGTDQGLKQLLNRLPKIRMGPNDYPFQLPRHSAFHTKLMREASDNGLYLLHNIHWKQPTIPMIDGRGHIWGPHHTDPQTLKSYTLQHQVLEPFDFSRAVRVALREYNPDHLVLLGPGETLGGAIAQVMIAERWRGIDSREAFKQAQQSETPPLIAMNRPDQARLVI